jgi:hypothetical protein
VLVSGGSAANMTALACAREALLGAMSEQVVAYVSDQAHWIRPTPRLRARPAFWASGPSRYGFCRPTNVSGCA